MDKKDKIVEILESWEKDNGHYFNSISESDYENIANEVVKLFAIPIVVGQSEQLDDHKCKPMVNADWTYLRCECGKRFEPKG